MKELSKILSKEFKVIVGGEEERVTDFLGLLFLMSNYSDFFHYSKIEQKQYFKKSIKEGEFYIDANITCLIK